MPKPFSMIREFQLADWFTLGNAVSGMGALFSAMTFVANSNVLHVQLACGLILAALIFDVFDGRIARSASPLPYDPSPTAQQPRPTTFDDAPGSVG